MGDDASMASGHMMDGDDDNNRSSSSTSKPDMNNNCFSQIQSRRFHRSSNHVPSFGSFCPSMDLIAIGMRSGGGGETTTGGSDNTLDGLLAANDAIPAAAAGGGGSVGYSTTTTTNHDDEFAESIVIHRILSWQSLLHLKLSQLTSSPTNDSSDTLDANSSISSSNNNEEDDNDNSILCSEDIERACININHPTSSSLSSTIGVRSCRVEENYEMKTKEKKKNYGATCIIWSPDGRYIAIGLVDGGC